MIEITKKGTYREVEVIFDEGNGCSVGRLGAWGLPGRSIKVDFDHLSAKSAIGGGPVNARRKVSLGDALPPPLALACLFLLFLRVLHGPLGSSRRHYLGRQAGALSTIALQDHDQRAGPQRNGQVGSPFADSD